MALSDTAIRSFKATGKTYKKTDSQGLYLEISPNGGKWWRWKYRVGGKEKRLAFGTYPDVSLAAARAKRDEARKLHAAGVDPGEHRRASKAAAQDRAANSFEVIAREWLAIQSHGWVSSHLAKQKIRLEKHVFPWIGGRAVAELGVADLRPLMARITACGHHEQAHRVLAAISSVFKFAVATERAERNPAADLTSTLPARRKQSFPTITEPAQVGGLLRAIDTYQGSYVTGCALKLAPLTFVRPGELRGAEWSEIHIDHPDGPRWVIPAARRKLPRAAKENPNSEPHVVPLSAQALAVLEELRPLTGHRRLLFPGARDPKRPMSENTINSALRSLGFDNIVGHGFRHMASTMLNELGYNPDAIERQLAHKGQGVRAIYNMAKHVSERKFMMQAWADFLDNLRAPADVGVGTRPQPDARATGTQ